MEKAALEDVFAPWGPVTARRMFGGLGVWRDGLMFALVAKGTLYLKTDDGNRAAFEAAGGRPFVYAGKGKLVSLGYWTPPASIFDDEDALREWADRAFAAAQAAQAVKRPRAREG